MARPDQLSVLRGDVASRTSSPFARSSSMNLKPANSHEILAGAHIRTFPGRVLVVRKS